MGTIKFDGTVSPWLVYKWPKNQIDIGSRLVVGQGQEVVFLKNGLPLDTFCPGIHLLTTASLPLLERISNQAPLAAEIYFVNKTARLDLSWEEDNLIQIFDPKSQIIVRIAGHGRIEIRVKNAQRFLNQISDATINDSIESYGRVESFFKKLAAENAKKALINFVSNQKIQLPDIKAQNTALSAFIHQAAICQFERFGVAVINFSVKSIHVLEEDLKRAKTF